MEMTARLTGDAKISTLKNDRQVVNFSVAINDSYRLKGQEKPVKLVTYVQCAYWVSPAIAPYLTKGKLVEMHGRIGVNAYKSHDGEAKASLTFHVNSIKLHGGVGAQPETTVSTPVTTVVVPADDLPF